MPTIERSELTKSDKRSTTPVAPTFQELLSERSDPMPRRGAGEGSSLNRSPQHGVDHNYYKST